MQAIVVNRFGGPEVLELAEAPDPRATAGTVLVEVHAAGVNPVDTYIRTGTYAFQPPLPYTPGMDAAGVVLETGAGVTNVAPGDRVYVAGSLSGTYAAKTLCAMHQVYPLPDALSFAQGAALGIPYSTAFQALFHRGRAATTQHLLIHGASGAVGLAAIQFAKAAGLVVVGTAGSEAGKVLVQEHGADHVLDHHDPMHLERALEITDGNGYHLILEMLANVNLGNDLRLLARFGRVVVIGSRGEVTINPRDLMSRDASVVGMTLMNMDDNEREKVHRGIAEGIAGGIVHPVISAELPLADAAKAHKDVIESSTNGKIVLIP